MPQGAAIAFDPIAGGVFLFWIDAAGNVCHGDPGTSGRPGPMVLMAGKQEAFDASSQNAVLSQAQLVDFQQAPFPAAKYAARGPHFVQVSIARMRLRADGKASKYYAGLELSVAEALDLNGESITLHPAVNPSARCKTDTLPLPAPLSPADEPAQHPTHCRARFQRAVDRASPVCVVQLPHGNELTEPP